MAGPRSTPPPDALWIPPESPGTAPAPPPTFSVGEVFARSLDAFAAEWSLFVLFALPIAVASAAVLDVASALTSLLLFAVALPSTAMTTLLADDLASGRAPAVGAIVRRGLRLTGLLAIVELPSLLTILPFTLLPGTPAEAARLPMGALLGALVLAVVGLYVTLRLSLAVPAVVIDDRRPLDAWRTSWRLTTGNLWRLIGLALVSVMLFFLLFVGSLGVAAATPDPTVAFVALGITDLLTFPLPVIAVALAYRSLLGRGAWAAERPSSSRRWAVMTLVLGLGVVMVGAAGALAQNLPAPA